MKKLLMLLLAGLLSFSLISCKKTGTNPPDLPVYIPDENRNAAFDEYVDGLLTTIFAPNDPNIIFTIGDPDKYGLQYSKPDFTNATLAQIKEGAEKAKEQLATLKTFQYDDLNYYQKLTYDILEFGFQDSIDVEPFFYFDKDELGTFIGTNSDLPYVYIAWPLTSKASLDAMLYTIDNLPGTFQTYIDFEVARAKVGIPKTEVTYKEIVSQAQLIVDEGDDFFLIEKLKERITEVPGLSQDETSDYQERIVASLKKNYIEAYRRIVEQLPKLYNQATPIDKSGLYHFAKGKDYYRYLLQYNVGVTESPDAIFDYLDKQKEQKLNSCISILQKNSKLDTSAEPTLYKNNNVNEMIEFLAAALDKDGAFPVIKKPQYATEEIDKSLQENFSPAAYFSPLMDMPYRNLVLINPSSNRPDMLSTVAHETYPGHLYQMNYVANSDLPLVRKAIGVTGYIEGWAKYADHFAGKYVPDVPAYKIQFFSDWNDYVYIVWAMVDVGVNDKGWDIAETRSFMSEALGYDVGDEGAEYYFNVIQENPTNMLQYYYSYFLIEDYKVDFKNKLGSKYSDLLFHRSVLEIGAVPLEMLKKHLNAVADAVLSD